MACDKDNFILSDDKPAWPGGTCAGLLEFRVEADDFFQHLFLRHVYINKKYMLTLIQGVFKLCEIFMWFLNTMITAEPRAEAKNDNG